MLRGGHAGLVAGTVAGVAGPLAFTAAWTIASLRQVGYPVTKVQISGLEAPGARDPWIMMAGFGVLGGSLIAFGWTLGRELGGTRQAGPGPWLMQVAGVLTIAAALLRRDHMLLTSGPGSWHNRAHNAVSAVLYILLVVVPLILAWRLRAQRRWRGLPGTLVAAALAAALILAIFVSGAARSWDGTLQRIGISIPLAGLATVAAVTACTPSRDQRLASVASSRLSFMSRMLSRRAVSVSPRSISLTDRTLRPARSASSSCVRPARLRNCRSSPASVSADSSAMTSSSHSGAGAAADVLASRGSPI